MEKNDIRLLMPFYNVEDLDFYFHLVRSLHKYFSEICITYVVGKVREDWKQVFSFQNLELDIRRSKSLEFFLSRKKIHSQLDQGGFDAIFVLSELWALEFSSFLSNKLNIPFIVWVRGDHRKVREARKINRFKRLIANHLEVKYLNQATFVVPNCMSLYEKLHEWGVKKSKITEPVHNGVDTDIFRPMNIPRSDRFTVAYAGRICPEKRIIDFLKIAGKLRDIEFIVAGSKAMEVTFPENVKYLGRLPFEQMPEFYNMADLLVLPSLTEGFPSVILEAYACEKPVLVTGEAFPKELRLFGMIADLNDFGQKIGELQKAELKSIGREARNYVKENFSWRQYGEQINVYLKKAISGEIDA
ncbi:MAG: glycosyltransferase family 4 protein [Thermoproteota archaeon]